MSNSVKIQQSNGKCKGPRCESVDVSEESQIQGDWSMVREGETVGGELREIMRPDHLRPNSSYHTRNVLTGKALRDLNSNAMQFDLCFNGMSLAALWRMVSWQGQSRETSGGDATGIQETDDCLDQGIAK